MTARKNNTLSVVAKVLGILAVLGALAGGTVATLGKYVYATKAEIIELEKDHVKAEGVTRLRDYRLKAVEVRVQNVESLGRRTDTNVEKLLTRFQLQAAPMPAAKPLPEPPPPDSLDEDNPE